MKPLSNMNNIEKGKLLAALFPEQVAGILERLMAIYAFLTENEEILRNSWDNPLLPFDFWYRQAAEVAENAKRHGISSIFQLFPTTSFLFFICNAINGVNLYTQRWIVA